VSNARSVTSLDTFGWGIFSSLKSRAFFSISSSFFLLVFPFFSQSAAATGRLWAYACEGTIKVEI